MGSLLITDRWLSEKWLFMVVGNGFICVTSLHGLLICGYIARIGSVLPYILLPSLDTLIFYSIYPKGFQIV